MTEVAVITGCASGIGKGLALEMHSRRLPNGEHAFKVYATDYRYDVVKDLEKDGLSVLAMDVTKQDSIDAAIQEIIKNEGRIDVCVCNAGISAVGYLAEIDYTTVERLFKVNVHGVFRTAQTAAKHMMAQVSGKIIIMGSTNAYFSPICNGTYSGAKSAVMLMAEALSRELKPFNISVTSVIPGWVQSDIVNNAPTVIHRFDRPGSFYQHSVPHLKVARKTGGLAKGSTIQETGVDITNAILKKKPKRYVYTGTMLWFSLKWGFYQLWGYRYREAQLWMQQSFLLNDCAAKGPRKWDGPYVPPPPENQNLKTNGEKSKENVATT